LGHKAFVLTGLGEYEQAEAVFLEVLETARQNSRLYEAGIAHANYGLLLGKLARNTEAVHHFEQAIKYYDLIPEQFHKCEALIYLAEMAMQRDEHVEAARFVNEALALAEGIPHNTVHEEAAGHRILGQICKAQGHFEEYVSHLETAISLYGEHHIGDEPYEVAVELADAFYERRDERMLEMYHRAVRYAEKTVAAIRQIR
jgi:tetratricopeptide (TPR) repeat protein